MTEPLDRSMLAQLAALIDECTKAYEDYDYARALERTESFFWKFCDQYLELVKQRAYGGSGEGPQASARAALQLALSVQLRLLAPVLAFVTEEVWSWWQAGSVHQAPWPAAAELAGATDGADPGILDVAAAVLGDVRRAKTEAKRSLRTAVVLAEVRADAPRLAQLAAAAGDVTAAGVVADLRTTGAGSPADPMAVTVELAPEDD